MHRMRGAFEIPLVRVRVALAPGGVRILAILVLLVGAGAIASIAQSPAQPSRASIETALVLALGGLTVLATVPALIDGGFRPLLVGVPSLALGLVAAASIGLDKAWPASLLAWLLVIGGVTTMVYHLLGHGLREPEA